MRPAHPEEIRPLLGADAGSLGAVGVRNAPVFVDETLATAAGMVTGANENDVHLEGVDVERDIAGAKLADLRKVKAGEGCTRCDGALELFKALEVGHVFKLGTKYSVSMKANVLLADGKEPPIVMGCYGIGVDRDHGGRRRAAPRRRRHQLAVLHRALPRHRPHHGEAAASCTRAAEEVDAELGRAGSRSCSTTATSGPA